MKLLIINGEKNDEKIEIQINEDSMVGNIKNKIDDILIGNGNFTKEYFKFIHKNIILSDDHGLKYYKMSENDKIWFGKIENYLKKDDVIVEVFHWGITRGSENFIVKRNDTISTIRSIFKRIHSRIINIWNAAGKQMKKNQKVTEIDKTEYYRLIVRCNDGKGNVINNTFDQCCYSHDTDWINRYLSFDQIRDDNKDESVRMKLMNLIYQMRQTISSNDIIDDTLNQILSDLPPAILNSTNLFCTDMASRFGHIGFDFCMPMANLYEENVLAIFVHYFPFVLTVAFADYLNSRQINQKKSIRSIIIDASNNYMKYLIDPNNDWKYWMKLWINTFLFISISDSEMSVRIDKYEIKKKMGIPVYFS